MGRILDNLCSDWHFDIDNLEYIYITVNGKEHIRKIYNCFGKAYIIFKNEKYYFDYPE